MIPILFVYSQRLNECLWYLNTKLDIFLTTSDAVPLRADIIAIKGRLMYDPLCK